jgi:subtilisin family serine protease
MGVATAVLAQPLPRSPVEQRALPAALAGWRAALEAGTPAELIVLLDDSGLEAAVAARRLAPGSAAAESLRGALRSAAKRALLGALPGGDTELLREYDQLPLLALRLRHRRALDALLAHGSVLEVYPNQARMRPTDATALALIGQPVALTAGLGGAGTTVVVLDSGLDYTLPEFGSCTAPGVPATCRVPVAFDTAADDGALDDSVRHGTRVGAVIAATAPQARVIGIDVFTGDRAFDIDIIEAINWAIANRATYNIVALNMSLGDNRRATAACASGNPFRVPVQSAYNVGVLSIVSSGNAAFHDADGNSATPPVFGEGISEPACTPLAVSVGAVYASNVGGVSYSACSDSATAPDRVTCFSQTAPILSLLAPGAAISAAGQVNYGTSFSAPFVAGAVAILRGALPGDGAAQTLDRLRAAGVAVIDPRTGRATPRLSIAAAIPPPTPVADDADVPLPAWALLAAALGLLAAARHARRH